MNGKVEKKWKSGIVHLPEIIHLMLYICPLILHLLTVYNPDMVSLNVTCCFFYIYIMYSF